MKEKGYKAVLYFIALKSKSQEAAAVEDKKISIQSRPRGKKVRKVRL